MIRSALFALFFSFLFSPLVFSQDPMAVKEQANQEVMAASRLMERGMALVRSNPSSENRKAAVALLIEAGQMFEHAGKTYQALVPQYASEEDVKNSFLAMQTCIATIQQLNQGQ